VQIVNTDGSPWVHAGTTGHPCTQADFDVMPDNPTSVTVLGGLGTSPFVPGSTTAHFRVQFHDQLWDQSNCLNLTNIPFHVTVS
jgi:hypothetical protein